MDHLELRRRFYDFFIKRDHVRVSSSSLLPQDDPSVLLTTAGMQQFKPYFVGLKNPIEDFGSKNTVSIQKSFRTADIDETGDKTHLTFFEMLGYFSFGGYWKEQAIKQGWEFITSEEGLNIEKDRVSATYYIGNRPGTTEDLEAKQILETIEGLATITAQPDTENFWGPTGDEGPCGPTVEFYVDGVEVGNVVFNEFYCSPDKSLAPLESKGIDTGFGFERNLAAVNKMDNVYDTDVLRPIMLLVAGLPERSQRIVADHARGAVFLLGDFVLPSNKEQGYILRRILRRLLLHIQGSGVLLETILSEVIDIFAPEYPELAQRKSDILAAARAEADKFTRTIDAGEKELSKIVSSGTTKLSGSEAFNLFATYGLPIDYIKEKIEVNVDEFQEAFAKHQDLSRAGAAAKFGGHGLSAGVDINPEEKAKITQLHTATHLLHGALHEVLGAGVEQAGSDINPERTRFDFTFPRKLTPEEITAVEAWVNDKIQKGFKVTIESLPYQEAIASGAMAFFKEKYPDVVTVYSVVGNDGTTYSRELCGGPHVELSDGMGHFKITKEESSSAGVRRIKAVLE